MKKILTTMLFAFAIGMPAMTNGEEDRFIPEENCRYAYNIHYIVDTEAGSYCVQKEPEKSVAERMQNKKHSDKNGPAQWVTVTIPKINGHYITEKSEE